jgi:predicted SprT family Zn-dependent metalloprotease
MRGGREHGLTKDRVVTIAAAQLASLAALWDHPRISELGVALNLDLTSTIARWTPPSNVIELNPNVTSRDARALREIITHEAAHVVVWDRCDRVARPHGAEWAAVMRAAGFQPRATLVRCGHRASPNSQLPIRHFCPVCHFAVFAKRRMRGWRCPECRAIGLEGLLNTERVSNR